MAQASPNPARPRPLSPHISIWRWGPGMALSILHRVMGQGMAFVGVPVLLWWLGALASGPAAYETFHRVAVSIPGRIVLVGLSWAFFSHFVSGLRHFVLDTGAGYELDRNNRWALVCPVLAIILTAAFWAVIIYR